MPADLSTKDKLILALDTETADQALQLIEELREYVGVFKVGLQLFCNAGPALLDRLNAEGVPVFFDGKFMDIPNTVAGATQAIVRRGVWMFNVHAHGGTKMMRAAVEACEAVCQETGALRPKIIAVTVLTSLGGAELKEEIGVERPLDRQVCALARLAKDAGLDGVVASAAEVSALRQACGADFLLVTPGVRPTWAAGNDQTRIVTPGDAIKVGADYLVVGRPVTGAKDRRDAAKRILDEMAAALS